MRALSLVLVTLVLRAPSVAADPRDVLTQHNDNYRSGAYTEQSLDVGNVRSLSQGGRFGKFLSVTLNGDIYAQPLYVANITTPDQVVRNLLYVATSSNDLYAIDADSGLVIWHKTAGYNPATMLCPQQSLDFDCPLTKQTALDNYSFASTVGIISTPVVSRTRSAIYVVAKSIAASTVHHTAYAFDLASGMFLFNKEMTGQITAPTEDGSGVAPRSFGGDTQNVLNRAALSLSQWPGYMNPILSVAFGGPGDPANYAGWVIGLDTVANLGILGAYVSTPKSGSGGIWQAGQGPASDTNGLYLATGNAIRWVGLCAVYHQQIGAGCDLYIQNPESSNGDADSFVQITTDAQGALHRGLHYAMPNRMFLDSGADSMHGWGTDPDNLLGDQDLGSSGPLLLDMADGAKLLVGGGKEGKLFILDRMTMLLLDSPTAPMTQIVAPQIPPPQPGNTCRRPTPPAPQIPDPVLPVQTSGHSRHIHGGPAYWNNVSGNPRIYVWGENDQLRAFELVKPNGHWEFLKDQPGHPKVVAHSAMSVPLGMPGGTLSLSANPGGDHAIIWATHPCMDDNNGGCQNCPLPNPNQCFSDGAYHCSTDAEVFTVPGIVRAFDASDLHELWNSNQQSRDAVDYLWGAHQTPANRANYAKFAYPTIANGSVFIPTFANSSQGVAQLLGYKIFTSTFNLFISPIDG